MARPSADVMKMVREEAEVKFVDFRFTDTGENSTCPCRFRALR